MPSTLYPEQVCGPVGIWNFQMKDEAVMGDEPGIPVHQIPPQNLVVRLFHREIHKSSHYQAHANRTFYQNITPNFTVTNVQKPPCFLRKFSPDGRQSGAVLKENGPKTHEIRRNIFDRFFRLKHTVSVATNGEQLNRECSLFTDDGKYVIVGSASVDVVNSIDHFDMYRNNESVTPNPRSPLEDYTLHIVDIEMGRLTDSRTFMHDKIFLSHNQGLYLYRHTLAVLSVQHQTIHIFQITPDGYFMDVRTIGRVCYEDDDYLLATVCTDRMQRSYHHTREKIINSLKHRYGRVVMIVQQIDYASEEVVTLRAAEPNGQPSFFVVYNMITTEVLAVYENTSSELLDLFEKMADFFRNARLSCESQFTCSPSNNTWARLIHKRFKKTFINARGGGVTEATKRLLGQLPISAQSFSASPYLDLTHFSYDDKWVSVMERPKSCADHPIRHVDFHVISNHRYVAPRAFRIFT
ncbi:DET1 [Portunus trituberculatus]|uniref:DET1 n=1 Tax=Portunus trituberculatus TaxID=210409 RepID=A0A5B7D5Q5_PORTR|nr:DET1 [Portunus trituberculatus]